MRRRHRKPKAKRAQRENSYQYHPSNILSPTHRVLRPSSYHVRQKETDYAQDRRLYTPIRRINPSTINNRPAQIIAPRQGKSRDSFRFQFREDPRNITVCRRRTDRRRVLFQLKVIGRGRGGAGFKKRLMNELSHVRCVRR